MVNKGCASLSQKRDAVCKTDTWIYVAVAVLGLAASDIPTEDEVLAMRKGLRGRLRPKLDNGQHGHGQIPLQLVEHYGPETHLGLVGFCVVLTLQKPRHGMGIHSLF